MLINNSWINWRVEVEFQGFAVIVGRIEGGIVIDVIRLSDLVMSAPLLGIGNATANATAISELMEVPVTRKSIVEVDVFGMEAV